MFAQIFNIFTFKVFGRVSDKEIVEILVGEECELMKKVKIRERTKNRSKDTQK